METLLCESDYAPVAKLLLVLGRINIDPSIGTREKSARAPYHGFQNA